MKRLLPWATCVLLLAACDTYPPGHADGPYYPPQDPYGSPEPYPPTTPYPPQGTVPPPGTGACPIVSSGEWRAWVSPESAPGSRPTLHLTGAVRAPSAGYRMEFEPHLRELRSYPVQVIARLRPVPPAGPAAQAITTHDLRWQWPLSSGPVGKVIIHCGERTLAEVPVAAAQ